jgi:hypothetical protein
MEEVMCKSYSIFAAFVLFISQQVFADMPMDPSQEGSCKAVAKACIDAGYTEKLHSKAQLSSSKHFWSDCMKPLELGQAVTGVKNVNPSDVTTCRQTIINGLQQQITDLQQAQASNSSTDTTTVTQ